jgi:GNAT superfamily N-acetyltransferase
MASQAYIWTTGVQLVYDAPRTNPMNEIPPTPPDQSLVKLSRFSLVEKLADDHEVADFNCGRNNLNIFLRRHALSNQRLGSSTTFVVRSLETGAVAAYYSLASSSVDRATAPEEIAQSLPLYSIPVILLARLAVDRRYQNRKLGQRLILDAMRRSVNAADHIGVRALMVHALDQEARRYYERWGFRPAPENELLLFLRMDVIRTSITLPPQERR